MSHPKKDAKAEPALRNSSQTNGPLNLLRPLIIMYHSATYIIPTLLTLLLTLQFSTLLSFTEFKDAWFARFWAWFGPRARDNAANTVHPLLHDAASGVCLDVGPGTGMWLPVFARARSPRVARILGVEPNRGMHAALTASARAAGLGDVYQVIGCGAQELSTKGGVRPESIDTIITVQCLCSIPTPRKVIRELYPLLKPGGKWLVFEHVQTKYDDKFVWYWQKIINLVWPHFLGGCDICRPTDQWLKEAGEWDEIDLSLGEGEGPYDTMPHIRGTLTKRRAAK